MDSRELITLPLVRVARLTSGTCSSVSHLLPHTVAQPFEGLARGNPQCRGRGTSSPDRSAWSAAGLLQTGSHHSFSPTFGADVSLTRRWTHANACPWLFSADIVRLDPSARQRMGESSQDDGLQERGYPASVVVVGTWLALRCGQSCTSNERIISTPKNRVQCLSFRCGGKWRDRGAPKPLYRATVYL